MQNEVFGNLLFGSVIAAFIIGGAIAGFSQSQIGKALGERITNRIKAHGRKNKELLVENQRLTNRLSEADDILRRVSALEREGILQLTSNIADDVDRFIGTKPRELQS